MSGRERIDDYAVLGDTQTAALVGPDGSVDWLCFPRFDSPACFAALLGDDEHGMWRIAPEGSPRATRRRYVGDSLILETEWETSTGDVRIVDFMPPRERTPDIVRIVEGVHGNVAMTSELRIRFGYGDVIPWVQRIRHGLRAIAGPDALFLRGPVRHQGRGMTSVADFTVGAGDRVPFVLTWTQSHLPEPDPVDALAARRDTEAFWSDWVGTCDYQGPWRDAVVRSLITLKALTYSPTGGIVAAATTSLPEKLGGVRNWDYRYCWLRDATFTLQALITSGFLDEARAWREWLLRAVAGTPEDLQIMYGVAGERRLAESEIPWLPGFAGSSPVRIGNAAVDQMQLDVYGELVDALALARANGLSEDKHAWALQLCMLKHLAEHWAEPDNGLWEIRGERQHFVHSKVMAWVAFDRAVRAVETEGREGQVDKWRQIRDQIHKEVCTHGFNQDKNSFVQHYDTTELDASLLLIPHVGFLQPEDPRVVGTIEAIGRELTVDGLISRYRTGDNAPDGLPEGEGVFLACSFWYADALALIGRRDEATALFERLLKLRNDLGLLAEEYDPEGHRHLGNTPQAFSHVALVNTAHSLTEDAARGHPRLRAGR